MNLALLPWNTPSWTVSAVNEPFGLIATSPIEMLSLALPEGRQFTLVPVEKFNILVAPGATENEMEPWNRGEP